MLSPREGSDERALAAAVRANYEAGDAQLRFEPLGEDSWCYRMGRLWVSLRRDLRGHRPEAYQASCELVESGLEFVLAPLRGRDGRVVGDFHGIPLLVFPYLECRDMELEKASAADVETIIVMMARLHASQPGAALPTESFELGFDDDLAFCIAAGRRAVPACGPLAGRVHAALSEHRDFVKRLRCEYEVLAQACARDRGPLVPTHGEPLASNFVRTPAGLRMLDWGALMWGPAERDWSHLRRVFSIRGRGRPNFIRLYDLRWRLSEIAEYGTILLADHAGTRDDVAMWHRLRRYLPGCGRAR